MFILHRSNIALAMMATNRQIGGFAAGRDGTVIRRQSRTAKNRFRQHPHARYRAHFSFAKHKDHYEIFITVSCTRHDAGHQCL